MQTNCSNVYGLLLEWQPSSKIVIVAGRCCCWLLYEHLLQSKYQLYIYLEICVCVWRLGRCKTIIILHWPSDFTNEMLIILLMLMTMHACMRKSPHTHRLVACCHWFHNIVIDGWMNEWMEVANLVCTRHTFHSFFIWEYVYVYRDKR